MTTIQRASLQSPSAHTHTYPAWPLLSPPASCPPRCVALPPSLCPLPACLPCVCLLGQNSRAHDDATLRYSLHSHSHPSLSIHIHPSTNHARGSCSYIRRGLPTPPSLSLLARKPVTTQGSSASHPPTPPSPPAVRSGARTLVPVCVRACVCVRGCESCPACPAWSRSRPRTHPALASNATRALECCKSPLQRLLADTRLGLHLTWRLFAPPSAPVHGH